MKNASTRMNLAAIVAMAASTMSFGGGISMPRERRERKPFPTMVTASREEIAAWNKAVDAKKPEAEPKGSRRFRMGARQSKRCGYLRHLSYAERHPTIAARYSF